MNRSSHFKTFWIILGLSLISLVIDLPKSFPISIHWKNINWDYTFNRPDFNINLGNFQYQKDLDLKYGLDLAGGAELTFEADTTNIKKEDLTDSLQSLKDNIERRVNIFVFPKPMSSFPPKMAATVSKSSFPVSKTSIRLFL
jgi:hypothetical protein